MDQRALLDRLYPLRRDLISDGFDQALGILRDRFPLNVHEYSSGMCCWTWVVPQKWSCEEAFVEAMDGQRVIDQRVNPLHVASYSRRMNAVVSRDELLAHIHRHPMLPDEAPFIFYYYQDNWGFGCSEATRVSLTEPQYRVVIDSRHENGSLKVAEWLLPGKEPDCIVLCAHLDHAAQANDGLAGVVTGLAVMEALARAPRRYTYRFLITAETIGSVAWLSQNESLIPTLKGGIFVEMTGLDQPPGLQLSYDGGTQFDRCCRHVHLSAESGAWVAPYRQLVGNDERQFNAPGVRVPMLSYARALPWGHADRPFREYHSAADNAALASAEMLDRSKSTVLAMCEAWDANYCPRNLFKGEVFLSGYGLAVDRHRHLNSHRNMLRIMDHIDGAHSLADIAEKTGMPFAEVNLFVAQLKAVGLVGDAKMREIVGRELSCELL